MKKKLRLTRKNQTGTPLKGQPHNGVERIPCECPQPLPDLVYWNDLVKANEPGLCVSSFDVQQVIAAIAPWSRNLRLAFIDVGAYRSIPGMYELLRHNEKLRPLAQALHLYWEGHARFDYLIEKAEKEI